MRSFKSYFVIEKNKYSQITFRGQGFAAWYLLQNRKILSAVNYWAHVDKKKAFLTKFKLNWNELKLTLFSSYYVEINVKIQVF